MIRMVNHAGRGTKVSRNSALKANDDRQDASVGYTLALIALVVAIVALGSAYAVSAWLSNIGRDEDPGLALTHLVTIGAQHYAVPAALMTVPGQRRDGFAEQLDMRMALPIGAQGALTEIDLTLVPRGRARTSATLLDSVYLLQFAQGELQAPPGLVGKPLEGDVGTRGETVWYDPLSPQPFVAKCMEPVMGEAEARNCLRVLQLSDRNLAIVSFPQGALANWRAFDAALEGAVSGFRE